MPRLDHVWDRADATLPSRQRRAGVAADRIARQGASSLARGGMHASVVDPSFGDDARALRVPMASGHELMVHGPHPEAEGSANKSWHASINPPGTDYHVGGEEVARADLGVFHPRELHSRVQAFLGHPDTMRALGQDNDAMVGQMQRQGRNAGRGHAVDTLGAQFGSTPRP